MSSPKEPSLTIEYFKEAIAYQISADRLYEQIDSQTLKKLPLRDPIYFLYHHAAELALKACLLSHDPGKPPLDCQPEICSTFAHCSRSNTYSCKACRASGKRNRRSSGRRAGFANHSASGKTSALVIPAGKMPGSGHSSGSPALRKPAK